MKNLFLLTIFHKKRGLVMRCTRMKKFFSLIELLVVLSVIAILMSLLQPSLVKALEFSKSTSCSSKLKQLSIVMSAYTSDYNDKYPYVYGAYNEAMPFDNFNYNKYTWDDFLGREHDGRDLTDAVARNSFVRRTHLGSEGLVATAEKLYTCPSDVLGNRPDMQKDNVIPRSYALNTYRGGSPVASETTGLSGGHQQYERIDGKRVYKYIWSKSQSEISLPNKTIQLAEVPGHGRLGNMTNSGGTANAQLYLWGRESMGELEGSQYHFLGYNYLMADGSVLNMLVLETEANNNRLWQTGQ